MYELRKDWDVCQADWKGNRGGGLKVIFGMPMRLARIPNGHPNAASLWYQASLPLGSSATTCELGGRYYRDGIPLLPFCCTGSNSCGREVAPDGVVRAYEGIHYITRD